MELKRIERIAAQGALTDEQIKKLHVDTLADILGAADHFPRLFEFLEDSYLFRQSYSPGDSHETAFKDGQRSVVVGLYEAIIQGLKQRVVAAARERGESGEQTHAEMFATQEIADGSRG